MAALVGGKEEEEVTFADLEECAKERDSLREVVVNLSVASLLANALHTAVLTALVNPLFLLNMLVYFLLRYYVLNRRVSARQPEPTLPVSR